MPQIMNSGGLFDASRSIYGLIPGAVARKNPRPHWIFPSGAIIYFAHLQYEDTVYDWQGTEITLICFDEATHFTESQFWYMLSRNRTTCGIKPYFRAGTNPDPESFVKKMIDWWIDPETGYAIPERSGVLRYFVRVEGEVVWADTREELLALDGVEEYDVKSFTFIMSSIFDNQELLKANPEYLGNLKALPIVEQERLLNGNWKIVPSKGLYFPRNRANLIETIPTDVTQWVRCWDLAATEDRKNTNPEDGAAYTAGVLIGKRSNGRFVIADVINRRMNADDVRRTIKNTAILDKAKYGKVRVRIPQDPGAAGKDVAEQYIKMMAGFDIVARPESGSKETRAEPLSAQWIFLQASEYGNVDVLVAEWTESYLNQMEAFPESKFKDMVDASANGFNELMSMPVAQTLNKNLVQANRVTPWSI